MPEDTPPETVTEVVETPQVEAPKQPTDAEINFKRLREEKERIEQERDKDRAMMMELQRELLRRNEAPKAKEVDDLEDVGADDLVTRSQAEKASARIAQEAARKAVEDYKRTAHHEGMEDRLNRKFSDFNSVVTVDNVKRLNDLEPDLARSLAGIQDEEAKAVAAYKFIKNFVPDVADNSASRQRIEANANKPKSLSSVGASSPLVAADAYANGLTPQLKEQLRKEMADAMKRV